MRNLVVVLAAIFALAAPLSLLAAEQGKGGHDMKTHAGMAGGVAHEAVVDGIKATFKVQTMADAMKAMGMKMPKGVRETHHISLELTDVTSGKMVTEGAVMLKVQMPDKKSETKELMTMHGHFGADFLMAQKGKYGVMAKFKVKDGKERTTKFWYSVR